MNNEMIIYKHYKKYRLMHSLLYFLFNNNFKWMYQTIMVSQTQLEIIHKMFFNRYKSFCFCYIQKRKINIISSLLNVFLIINYCLTADHLNTKK